MNTNHIVRRLLVYLFGLFIMTVGITVSVKSDLGVSPVSSIPYTITCVWGMEMGRATILFHAGLIIIQILILRKAFKLKNLLQLPAGIVFGYFTTFGNYMMSFLPDPGNFWIQLLMMLLSAFLIAFGVFLYVPADIIPLAGEGVMLAVAEVTSIKFSTIKLLFDCSMVAISLATCLLLIHALGSVGLGTVIAAVLVGTMLKLITRVAAPARDRLLCIEKEEAPAMSPLTQIMKEDVYTLSPEMDLLQTLQFFMDKGISGAPVVGREGQLKGYISDGDIMRFLSADQSLFINSTDLKKISFNERARALTSRKVSELIHGKVITVDISDDLDTVCTVLSEHGLKKVPVMKDGRMAGVINASNITKYAVSLMSE